jgi:hypothetical protein
MPPSQTWNATTGGTEIADKIRYSQTHKIPAPEASSVPDDGSKSDTGKVAGLVKK